MQTTVAVQNPRYFDLLSGSLSQLVFNPWQTIFEHVNYASSWTTCSYEDYSKSVLDFLAKNGSTIQDAPIIKDFLYNQPELITTLYQAPEIIKKEFGNFNTKLEIFLDPEYRNNNIELFLTVKTELDPAIAIKKITNIENSWLFIQNQNVPANFNLNLEYL